MKISSLYISYFGLREPLVQTQVLPYLRQLVGAGFGVKLLTFEPQLRRQWTKKKLSEERERLKVQGIEWFCLPYHKRPSLPATLYDIVAGARLASWLIRKQGVRIIHARSHVPAAMGAIAKWMSGGYLIFDIRGFMPEEYTDGGVWPEGGYLYRGMKRVERFLFASSDAFVVLTEKAREILFPGCGDKDMQNRPVEVIPCCVDFGRYREADAVGREELRRELNLTGRRVVVYVGSFGGWYMTDETARFFAIAHREDPNTYSLILTQSDPEMVSARLREMGVRDQDFFVGRVSPEDVPRYLRASDVAVSFIKACYSKLSSSPTKIGEYLAGGLPVVTSAGVGDVDSVIEGDRVGVVLRDFNDAAYSSALRAVEAMRVEGGLSERCRASAETRFDIERVGGVKYRRLYERLLQPNGN
jgi:glycosyltransferase involved in cell wall biosynthesis